MKLLGYFRSVAAKFFHASETEAEMEEELRSHIRHRADDLERSGLDRAEAQRRARIEFGGHQRFREECNEALGGNFIETFIRDVRFSFRLLRKSPGFTLVAVLTLALAIGANAVVFGVLNAMILRPLDVPRPESLYTIEHMRDKSLALSYPDYLYLRDHNRSLDGLAAYKLAQAGLDTGGNPSRAFVDEVSGNYFDVFGLQPYLGRFFHASDEHGPNTAPYIMLNYAYWHNHFQNDPGVIGRTVRLNKHPFTIIGVAPPGFHGPVLFFSQDFFVPLVNQEQVEGQNSLNARGSPSLFMTIGHLKPGVTPQQAIGDLNSIGSYLEKTYPETDANMRFGLARPSLFGDFAGPPVWRGPREASTSHGSLSDRQVGIHKHAGAADRCPRPIAGRANSDLRRADYLFHGCRARTHALARREFRFRSAERDAARYGCGYGRLSWRRSARDAKAHAGGHGDHSWCNVRGIC